MASGFRGAVFDVDGVLVDSPHERAWRDALQQLTESDWSDVQPETSYAPDRFTPQVYQQVMSGKPRFSGAQAALEYFGVPDAERRAKTYGDRKQELLIELIEAGEFTAYPDALRFIIAVKDAGIPVAAASSSKNAGLFLGQIRLDSFADEHKIASKHVTPGTSLLDFFDADISGRDFAQGKPHPEIFLTAAHELGAPPEECFVIEDAVTGIQAAKAGHMGALGLARAEDEELLAAAEPDLLVSTLDDVDLSAVAEGRLAKKGS
jgi:beta-phosphoglucomutase-like phosphatase (HAD superfamily)